MFLTSGHRRTGTTRRGKLCASVWKRFPDSLLTDEEARLLAAVAEKILPQPDRGEIEKIPIVPWIDEKLSEDKRDGYRDEGMPPQRDAWGSYSLLGSCALKQIAHLRGTYPLLIDPGKS